MGLIFYLRIYHSHAIILTLFFLAVTFVNSLDPPTECLSVFDTLMVLFLKELFEKSQPTATKE